ncbi:MAG: YecA family protein [Gammaproteobacteria bacterium]|nr:YecA family protein [Gammaproteobacteria bacterium]
MSSEYVTPLSDDEIVELDNFLLSGDEEEDERLSVDEAHGYITALVVSADATLFDEGWMQGIWGDPAFHDDDEKERMVSLLWRMRNDINNELSSGEVFEPLIVEEEEDGELLETHEGWCYGFMLAVSSHQHLWEDLPRNEQELLMPIARLAMLASDEDADIDDEEYSQLVELVPGAVGGLYAFWRKH